jgi:hypothetical protein
MIIDIFYEILFVRFYINSIIFVAGAKNISYEGLKTWI